LGPNGLRSGEHGFGRPVCCGTFSNGFQHRPGFAQPGFAQPGFAHRPRGGSFVGSYSSVYAYPYYAYPYPVYVEPEYETSDPANQFPEEEYRGGPTIFDRRGPGPTRVDDAANTAPQSRNPEPAHYEPSREPEPAADQPQTLLVFKDGHQLEVQNYAIVGDTLVDLTEGHRRKVPLADLDVESTAKQNDDRGIDFRLPPKPRAY
jgi:hypothetical protein